jgi:hypothetical protein
MTNDEAVELDNQLDGLHGAIRSRDEEAFVLMMERVREIAKLRFSQQSREEQTRIRGREKARCLAGALVIPSLRVAKNLTEDALRSGEDAFFGNSWSSNHSWDTAEGDEYSFEMTPSKAEYGTITVSVKWSPDIPLYSDDHKGTKDDDNQPRRH